MNYSKKSICVVALVLATLILVSAQAQEADDQSATDLAKKTQNPVADLISVPFQNNINFETGPEGKTQNILNIQPVIPLKLDEEWNLITRTISPVIHQVPLFEGDNRVCGVGDTQFTGFLSPRKPGKLIWGVGPIFQFPTNSDDKLGTDKWAVGPSVVVLKMEGPWVYGALWNQLWSYTGEGDAQQVNQMLIQPFINYNMPKGWYLVSAPIITADWKADSSDQWTIPIGGGVGRVTKIGKQPINWQVSGYYNTVSPRQGPDWQLRIQLQLLFPK